MASAEASVALGTPITGGNVSLYNETRGEGIYPTPVIGIVGILDDVTKAVPADFQQAGDAVLLLMPAAGERTSPHSLWRNWARRSMRTSSWDSLWGTPSYLSLTDEAQLHQCLKKLAEEGLLQSACDVSDGGIAATLAQASFEHSIGVRVELIPIADAPVACIVCSESPRPPWFVTCDPQASGAMQEASSGYGDLTGLHIGTTAENRVEIRLAPGTAINATGESNRHFRRRPSTSWCTALESMLHDEVTA